MNEVESKILSKIKKCLALSKSSEPHEAAAALRQAQAMMHKYGITEDAVDMPRITSTDVRSTAVSRPKTYEIHLLAAICKAFGCMMWWNSGWSHSTSADGVFGRYTILGPSSQVAVASYTATVLMRRMAKARAACRLRYLAEHLRTPDRRDLVAVLDSFCYGWVAALSKVVNKFANPAKVASVMQEIYDSNTQGVANVKHNKNLVGHFVNAGYEEGSHESIQRPVETQRRESQLYIEN